MKYIITYLVDDPVKSEIDALKREIAQKFDVHRALDYPPHITLKYPFETNNIRAIEAFLEKYAKQLKSFPLHLRGFGNFDREIPEEGIVLSWNVHILDSPDLLQVRKELTQVVNAIEDVIPNPKDVMTRLYVTLAYADVTQEKFERIGEFLQDKTFSRDLVFDNITLLKFENKWVLYKQYLVE